MDHPTIAYSLNNLGRALTTKATSMCPPPPRTSLVIRQARLDPDHPDTARSLNNLGVIQQGTGDLQCARSIHERAFAIREARLGSGHPDTAYSLMNLGKALRDQGNLS